MDLGHFIIKKEVNILDIGLIIRCKEKGHYTIQIIKKHMKVNGKKINFKDGVYYIMKMQNR
jgi:hypothetical protein